MLVFCAECSSKVDFSRSITTFSSLTLANLPVIGIPIVRPMHDQVGVDLVVQLSVVQVTLWVPLLLCFLEFWNIGMDFSPTSARTGDSVLIEKDAEGMAETVESKNMRPRLWIAVNIGMALNPSVYAWVLGVAWAVIAHRFGIQEKPFDLASNVRLSPKVHQLT